MSKKNHNINYIKKRLKYVILQMIYIKFRKKSNDRVLQVGNAVKTHAKEY